MLLADRVGVATLEQRLDVSRSTIARWVRQGVFPAPHFVGEKRAWYLAEIQTWEAHQMARRPNERVGASNLGKGRK